MRTATALTTGILLMLVAAPFATAVLPVQLTISGPAYALVDDVVIFSGQYGLARAPLPAMKVTLYVDDEAVASVLPIAGGYQIAFAFASRGAHSVYAVADEGGPGEARSSTLAVRAAVPPSPATSVLAFPVAGAITARVTWEPPVDDGGASMKQYRVERQDGAGAWIARQTLAANLRAFTESGLIIGHQYRYRVVAVNQVASAQPAEAPLAGSPPLPPLITASPVHLSDQVRVQVASGGGPTQQIDLERSVNGGAWYRLRLATGASLVYTETVWPEWTVLYRASAKSLVGNSTPTVAGITGELPGAPTSVVANVPGLVRVEWSAPSEGGPVQGYRVLEDGVVRKTLSYDEESVDLTTTAGTHAYTVIATSLLGAGPASEAAIVTLALPGAPMSLTAIAVEEDLWGRVNLSWSPPADDGGAPILNYRVYRTPLVSGGVRVLVGQPTASSTTWSDAPLADGRTYRYEVEAANAAGAGALTVTEATVEDFQWTLQHALSHFRACETVGSSPQCTNVASGGTYDRQGSGAVSYSAVYSGLLTRKGEPVPGRSIYFYMYQVGEDELTETPSFTTNAAGQYTATWNGLSHTPSGACSTFEVVTWASYWDMDVHTSDMLTICP